MVSTETPKHTTSQISLAIKSLIETAFGDIRAVTNYEMDKERNIRGNFRDRRTLNHAFRITADGKLSYAEIKSGRSDAFEIGLHLNGLTPVWLSEEYLKGMIETHLDKGPDQCSKGTPCGQACIERGDRCRINIPPNQIPKLMRVQNAIAKAQDLPIMQSPRANLIAGAVVAAVVVGLGSQAIINKRIADERGRADRITERRVERNKKFLEGEYEKALEAESKKQKTQKGKELEAQKGKLQDANKAKIETLQQRSQERLSRLENQYKQRLAKLEATVKSKTAAQEAEYKQRAKTLEAEHKAKIAAQDADYKAKVKELEAQNKVGQKTLTTAQESAYKQRVKDLEDSHKAKIAEQDKSYKARVKELEDQNKSALKTEADAQESAYKQRVKDLEDAHKAKIAEQDKSYKARVKELEAQYKANLNVQSEAQTEAYDQRVKDLEDSHKAKIAEQDKSYKARVKELEAQHKASLKTQADNQTKAYKQRVKDLEDQQKDKIAEQDRVYNERLKALEDDYQARVAEQNAANEKRAQEIEEQGQMLIGAQTSAHNISYEKRVRELDEQHQARIAEQNSSYEKRAAELESQHQQRLEEIERDRAAKSNQLENDHKQRLKEVSDREFELEQRESVLKEREANVEERSRNLGADHDQRMASLERDFSERLVQIEREFLNRSTELSQRSEQLEDNHRQRSRELEDSYTQRLQQLQDDFRTRFEQESAAERERVNDEFIRRMAAERESMNAAAQEQIRKATQPKANRPGTLVSTSESGINLSASVDQGMPLGGTSGLTREAMQDRIDRALNKSLGEQRELGMKNLAESFRARTKEIQTMSSGIPRDRRDAQKKIDAKWNALERALMQQNRREAGFEEAAEEIRKTYKQGHTELLDQLFQESEQSGGVYSERSLKKFDQAAAKLHKQMLRQMQKAITDLNKAQEMRLDKGKRCGNGWTNENNQCRTPGVKAEAPLPTLTRKKLLTGAAIATVAAVGIGTAIALNRKPRQPPEPRHHSSSKSKVADPKTPAKKPAQPKATDPKSPAKEPAQTQVAEPQPPEKKPAQHEQKAAWKRVDPRKRIGVPKDWKEIPKKVTNPRDLVWVDRDGLSDKEIAKVNEALDIISSVHQLDLPGRKFPGQRQAVITGSKYAPIYGGKKGSKHEAGNLQTSILDRDGKDFYLPTSIALNGKSEYKKSTLSTIAHEYGHLLDVAAFGQNKGFASESLKTPQFKKVMDEINSTPQGKYLESMSKTGRFTETHKGRTVRVKIDKKYVRYLNDPSEKFARAYEQYITVKSGNEEMRKSLKRELKENEYAPFMYWSDKRFQPIEKAFDDLFTNTSTNHAGIRTTRAK